MEAQNYQEQKSFIFISLSTLKRSQTKLESWHTKR